MQTQFRALVSKLNILSLTARLDVSYKVKILTTRYGKASKFDIMQTVKLLQKVKRMSSKITIPSLGGIRVWILVAYSDAATKKIYHAFSLAGHVVFLVNKRTHAASPITWSSKKIE